MAFVVDVVKEFVSDSTSSLVSSIIRRISTEIKLARGFKADLQDLERQVKRLDDVLRGSQPGNNGVLNDWLKRIRELAYQAEDVMDEYSYELLRRKIALENRPQQRLTRRVKTKARVFFSLSSNPVVVRFQMAHKVKSLKESIDKIYQEAEKQGIRPVEVTGGKPYVYNSDHDHDVAALSVQREMPNNEVIFGRGDEECRIFRLLSDASNSDKHLSVVAVFGMAELKLLSLTPESCSTAAARLSLLSFLRISNQCTWMS